MKKFISVSFFALTLCFIIISFIAPTIEHKLRLNRVVEEINRLQSGFFSVIESSITADNLKAMNANAKQLQEKYALPVSVVDVAYLQAILPKNYLPYLDGTSVIYQYEQRMLYKRIEQTQAVIALGPFQSGQLLHGDDYNYVLPLITGLITKKLADEPSLLLQRKQLKQYQTLFKYPLKIVEPSEQYLSPTHLQRLSNGETITIDKQQKEDIGLPAGTNLKIYSLTCIDNCQQLLRLGPISEIERPGYYDKQVYLFSYSIFFLVYVVLWVSPLIWQFRRMNKSVLLISSGQLNHRINISALSALSPIAKIFNRMVERTQSFQGAHNHLVDEMHKNIDKGVEDSRKNLHYLREKIAIDGEKPADNDWQEEAENLLTNVQEMKSAIAEVLNQAKQNQQK